MGWTDYLAQEREDGRPRWSMNAAYCRRAAPQHAPPRLRDGPVGAQKMVFMSDHDMLVGFRTDVTVALTGEIECPNAVSDWSIESVRRHINPAKLLERRLVGRRPLASFSSRLVVHTVVKANAVGQNLFRLALVLAPDRKAREVLVGFVDTVVGKRHGNEDFVVARINGNVQTRVVLEELRSFHGAPRAGSELCRNRQAKAIESAFMRVQHRMSSVYFRRSQMEGAIQLPRMNCIAEQECQKNRLDKGQDVDWRIGTPTRVDPAPLWLIFARTPMQAR